MFLLFLIISYLLVYKAGFFLNLPYSDLNNNVNFSGFSINQSSVFIYGIMPFVSSSIFFTLLKSLEGVKAEKYNFKNIYALSLFFGCFLFSISHIYNDVQSIFNLDYAIQALNAICGISICVWLALLVSKTGLINGMSFLIFITVLQFLKSVFVFSDSIFYIIVTLSPFIFLMVFFEISFFKILFSKPRYYNNNIFSDNKSYLPLKINNSGIMPLIILYAIDYIISPYIGPAFYPNLLKNSFYVVIIFSLIKFYSPIILNVSEIAAKLKKSNIIVDGLRPGESTVKYFSSVQSYLDFLSLAYLSLVMFYPSLVLNNYSVSGLSVLILITVSLEIMSKVSFYKKSDYNF